MLLCKDISHRQDSLGCPTLNPLYWMSGCFFFVLTAFGCAGDPSVPPYPPPLTLSSLNLELIDGAVDPDGSTPLRLKIAGLRNAKQGLYVDLLAVGEDAQEDAMELGGLVHLGRRRGGAGYRAGFLEPSECVEIRRCDGEVVEILRPIVFLRDYAKASSRPLFATPLQVNPWTMAGPTYDLPSSSDVERVIQVISVRTPEQLGAGCYEIRILPTIRNVVETELAFDLDWHRFDLQDVQ